MPRFYDNKANKPLHIRSLEEQVSHNPDYMKIAKSISGGNSNLEDAYFYALKDAYERSGFAPTDDDIAREASNAYYGMTDDYRRYYGMNDRDWDEVGWPDFEEKYGTEDQFIERLLEAYKSK